MKDTARRRQPCSQVRAEGCWHTSGSVRRDQVRSTCGPGRGTSARRSASRGSRRIRRRAAVSRRRGTLSAVRATTGMWRVRSSSRSARATSLPSMSGRRRSSRTTSGRHSRASAMAARAARRLDRPEPRAPKDVLRELPVPLVVVDDEHERGCRAGAPSPGLEDPTSSPYPHAVAIRIVLAEDEYLVREGLRRLLETQGDLEVVAVCEDLASLLDTVDAERPDVVVTDIRMPPGHTDEGIQAADTAARDESRCRRRRAQPARRPELRARTPRGRQREAVPTS